MSALVPARERLDRLIVRCPCCCLRFPVARSLDAATSELATDIAAAEDVIDPRAVPTTCHQPQAPLVMLGQGEYARSYTPAAP